MKLRMRLNMMTTLSWIFVAVPVFAETNYNFQFQKSPAPASESAPPTASPFPATEATTQTQAPASSTPTAPNSAPAAIPATTVQTIAVPSQEIKTRNTSVSFGFGRFYADDSSYYENNGGEFSGYSLGASYMATPYVGVSGNIIFGKTKTTQYEIDDYGYSSSHLESIDRNLYMMGLLYKPFPTLEYFDFGLTGGMLSYSEGASKDLYYLGAKFGFKLNPFATANFEMTKPIAMPGKDKTAYSATIAWNF